MPTPEFYCRQLRKTKHDAIVADVAISILTFSTDFHDYCDGDKGDDEVLIEIMCAMSNNEIRRICATYQQMFNKRLEQGIRDDKIGNFKKLLQLLAAGSRDESTVVNEESARKDAELLKKYLKNSLTDEMPVIEILCKRSFAQLKAVNQEYKRLTGSSLEKSFKKNFSDSVKDALIAIIRTANNPLEFYARRINKVIIGYSLDSRSLGRLIVVRSEIDLMDIKGEFNQIFRKSLKSCLKHEISGSYKHALLTLLGDV